jgi:tRNA threonylcarbamoyladenosine biosynthesis protein TsaE
LTTFVVDIELAGLPDTQRLGRRVAQALVNLKGGVVLLDGALGVGKTTLVQAIAQALGVEEPVTSPTFDLLHKFVCGGLSLYHVDGYRLANPQEWDVLDLPPPGEVGVVLLAEWADLLKLSYGERLEVHLARCPGSSERHATLRALGDGWVSAVCDWGEEARGI